VTLQPGFGVDPASLAVEGAVIGFLIALPVGPVAALCIRRAVTAGAMAGYLSGLGAALGDALFGAIAALALGSVQTFLTSHQPWILGAGGIVLTGLGWNAMRQSPGGLRDPKEQGRASAVTTRLGFTGSGFLITILNPLTVVAFGAAFVGRDLSGAATSPEGAAALVAGVFCGALSWWVGLCSVAVVLRSRFSGSVTVWCKRVPGMTILAFGLAELASLLPLPWLQLATRI
jgi:threonine/homoserine/homoserine lactone efflux protein